MKGKFRKRADGVWCPKPKEIIDTKQLEKLLIEGKFKEGQEYPKKKCKVTGWQNMDQCYGCQYLEEYHVENDGVFCLFSMTSDDTKLSGKKEVE